MKKYDAIIVGTGVSGCFAALHLPTSYNVLMISKAGLDESDSYLAQGGICVKKDEDDFSVFMEDTLKAGHYENNKDSVEVMINSSPEIITELMEFGVRFQEENGELSYTKEGGHSINRILHYEDITGKEITSKLLEAVQKRNNITILSYTTMVDILTKYNECYGIVLETQDGNIEKIFAKHTVWACGGIGGIFEASTNYAHLTADPIAISINKNIKLKDIHYIQIHPTTLFSKEKGKRFLISESVRGEGAILLNKDGERFVNELLPRDKVAAAIHEQMKKDEKPYVWLSMMSIEDCQVSKRFPNIYQKCLEEGYDPEKEWIPVVPAQHYMMGGVEIDLWGKTSMEHLFAVGEISNNGVHGANRLASNSLLESLVFAKRAAMRIVEQAGAAIDEVDDQKDFQLAMEEYEDIDAYNEKQRDLILAEIEREKQNEYESDNDQAKCG